MSEIFETLTKSLSPIERMIDAACGRNAPPPRPKPTAEQKESARVLAEAVLHHIDTTYPAMWSAVPRCARTSVRNIIIQQNLLQLTGGG